MATKPLPTPEQLRQLLRYEPETGRLYWRERGPGWFTDGRHKAVDQCARWNNRLAGKQALSTVNHAGYYIGPVLSRNVLAHRAVWAIHHGEWPAETIDHINGDRTDNRLVNLRAVSQQENARNMRLSAFNTSGVAGVGYDKANKKWRAKIGAPGGKTVCLGRYDRFEDAVAARKSAESKYDYHPNHGLDAS